MALNPQSMAKHPNVLIIDDELTARSFLLQLLRQNFSNFDQIYEAASAEEGRQLLAAHPIPIIFLDIMMPRENGLEFVESLAQSEAYLIVFVSAYDEYAIQAFEVNALHYLLKPLTLPKLQQSVEKIFHHYHFLKDNQANLDLYQKSLGAATDQLSQSKPARALTIRTTSGFSLLQFEEIVYLEAAESYTIFHLQRSAENRIIASGNIKSFERMLSSASTLFFRIHKNTIINYRHLQKYVNEDGSGYVVFANKQRRLVSRRRKKDFFNWVEALTH